MPVVERVGRVALLLVFCQESPHLLCKQRGSGIDRNVLLSFKDHRLASWQSGCQSIDGLFEHRRTVAAQHQQRWGAQVSEAIGDQSICIRCPKLTGKGVCHPDPIVPRW